MEIESTEDFKSVKKYSNNHKNIKISIKLLLEHKKEIFENINKIYIIRTINTEKKINLLYLSMYNFNNKLNFIQNDNFKLNLNYNYLPNSLKVISNITEITPKSFLPNKIKKMFIVTDKNILKKNIIPYNLSEIFSVSCLNIKNFSENKHKIKYENMMSSKLSDCYINKYSKKMKNIN